MCFCLIELRVTVPLSAFLLMFQNSSFLQKQLCLPHFLNHQHPRRQHLFLYPLLLLFPAK